ncbi:MAG: hypothetical protein A2Y15_00090 [Clostridiales bacterium GWF2_36_10]|nr:MAG: hypothetical protein A2Y15_00090 [Clostridiales bacterium GWF2_36_10]HAN20250.1 hypothetical protein [Clostridiales bacterium]
MQNKTEFFAGANTKNGYTSCFFEIVGKKYKKVYILKGSAGCGKSTFMKRVGERAIRDNHSVEYIRCSADLNSYDGILLPDMGVAIVDGTAPHIMDVKYPSARENIINLGSFWDENKLKSKREELINLTNRKLDCYEHAYHVLSAVGSIRGLRNILINRITLEDKLKAFTGRICKKLIKSSNGSESIRIQTAFNENGFDSLPTFSNAQNVYLIRDKYDIAYRFLLFVREYADKVGAERIISFDPIDISKPEAIYFPKEDLLFVCEKRFVPSEKEIPQNKPINTSRFIDKKGLAAIRQKDRAAFKLYNALLETASHYFGEAHKIHDNIERIYIRAMDFAKLTDYTNKFLAEIFG